MADALVIPGQLFGPAVPLPMYVGNVAERRGASVHRHTWSREPPSEPSPGLEEWVRGEIRGLVAGAATDHGMYVPGPLTDSIAVLARVVVAAEEFLDAI